MILHGAVLPTGWGREDAFACRRTKKGPPCGDTIETWAEGTCVGDDVSRTEECSHWWVGDVKGWTGSCV